VIIAERSLPAKRSNTISTALAENYFGNESLFVQIVLKNTGKVNFLKKKSNFQRAKILASIIETRERSCSAAPFSGLKESYRRRRIR